MARRRASRTKKRSLRSFGAVLVNAGGARRRRRNPPRATSIKVRGGRKHTTKVRKSWRNKYATNVKSYTRKSSKPVRAHARRKGKKGTRRSVHKWNYKKGRYSRSRLRAIKRRRKAKRNPRRSRSIRKTIARRRKAPARRRKTTRRRKARSNPRRRVITRSRKRKGSKRKSSKRRARRNPAFLSGIQKFAKKIPLVGGLAAKTIGFAPHMAVAALSIEAPLQLLAMPAFAESKIGAWFAARPHAALAASGILMALGAQYIPSKFVSAPAKQKMAIALSSAGAGAAYLSWRQNGGSIFGAVTLGALDMGAVTLGATTSYGEGPAYTVSPMGGGYGAVVLGG
jgi:hypothetical protein